MGHDSDVQERVGRPADTRATSSPGSVLERAKSWRPGRPSPARWAVLAAGTLVAVAYLLWAPQVPDLAAQVARTNVVRTSGLVSWWDGWFAGLSLPTYSLLAPPSMALLGVRATGLLAVFAATLGTRLLVRDSVRPRAATIAFAAAYFANLLNGRVTFAVGVAFAVWSLVALRMRKPWACVLLAFAAYFASPLAGMFLGMVMLAVLLLDATRRRLAATAAGCLLIAGVAMALLFPGTGQMPFSVSDTVPAGLCSLAVAIVCRNRIVRTTAWIAVASLPLFLVVPSAVGTNITRFAWLAAAPVLVAYGRLPRKWLVPLAVGAALLPACDLSQQLYYSSSASAKASYYAPLEKRLAEERAAAPESAVGQRVEVIDTVNHWGTVYLADQPLARGWDRQADRANNQIFYDDEVPLDSQSYHEWLHELAVGWVALPTARLDYASVREAALVRGGLAYLELTWSNDDWRLYRVVDATPLADGATVHSVDRNSITMSTTSAATVAVRLRYSPYLTVREHASGEPVPACVVDSGGWVQVMVPRAGTVVLSSEFDPRARLGPAPGCVEKQVAGTG